MKKQLTRKLSKMLCIIILLLTTISSTAFASEEKERRFQQIGGVIDTPQGPRLEVFDKSLLQTEKTITYSNGSLPKKLDLRDKNEVTSVKDQGVTGTCWAFAAMSTLESNLIKQGLADHTIDLSERQLAYFNYFGEDHHRDSSLYAGKDSFISKTWEELYQSDPEYYKYLGDILDRYGIDKDEYAVYQMGGHYSHVINTLSRTYGVTYDKNAPYETIEGAIGMMDGLNDSIRTMSDIKLKNLKVIADDYFNREYQPNVTQDMKRAIMENGAVGISYYADSNIFEQNDDSYYNVEHHAQYTYHDENVTHSVTIVGWDDDFSKDNFNAKKRPEGDGAWIVKNSWGTDISDEGYFYLSYYDKSLYYAYTMTAMNQKNKEDQYDNLYQYDGVGFGEGLFFSNEISVANVFTTRGKEQLKSIGIEIRVPDADVQVSVYTDWKDDDITSGTLRSSKQIRLSNTGYYTIPLDTQVYLDEGKKYAVVISEKYMESNGEITYLLPLETQIKGSYSSIDFEEGQSFFTDEDHGEKVWKDVVDLQDEGFMIGNAVVKAMSVNTDMNIPELIYDPSMSAEQYLKELNKNNDQGTWSWKDESVEIKAGRNEAVYTTKDGEVISVSLNMNKATPVIDNLDKIELTYGDILSMDHINAIARVNDTDIKGSLVLEGKQILREPGSYEAVMEFIPEDEKNYERVKKTISYQVKKRDIVIQPKDSNIAYEEKIPTSFDYEIIEGNLLDGDTFTITWSTNAKKEPGNYEIIGVVDSDRYNVIIKRATLKISEKVEEIMKPIEDKPQDLKPQPEKDYADTGDQTQMGFWMMILLISGMGLGVVVVKRWKNKG